MSDEDDDRWENYESGPFCAHWGDYDCECVCGHRCGTHDENGAGSCSDCECSKFTSEDESLKDQATAAFQP